MSEFRFVLNGTTLVDHPDGWQDFTESITRDEGLHGFTLSYENNLTFVGDGYAILNDLFLNNYCAETTLRIDYRCDVGFVEFCTLLIKITDLDQNLNRCTCEAKATDVGYYGMIHSNRDVPVRLSAEYSKNGVEIDSCPSIGIRMFIGEADVSDVIQYYPDLRYGYDQRDALAFVLRFITDNRITTVQSDYLDDLSWAPDAGVPIFNIGSMGFAVMSGVELRLPSEQPPIVTFAGLMSTIYSLHNLFWRVDGSVLRLEPYDFFFQDNELTFDNQTELIRSTDVTKLYSKVVFGSGSSEDERSISNTYPDPVNWSMPFVDLIAHGKQEYPLTGVCQTDVALNLTSEYIYDSNLIEKVMYDQENLDPADRPDQGNDNDVFYVQYTTWTNGADPSACFSIQFILPTTPIRGFTFNPYLWHKEVIARHTVQSDLVLYEANNDDNFKATAEAPNAWVGDFASPMLYFSATEIDNSTQSQMFVFFNISPGVLLWPKIFTWGGIFNNAYSNCEVPESACTDQPINLQFNNDSTGGNFDPNNNWNTTDFYYECPATGVYGFEVEAYINKVRDQISYEPDVNTYFNIEVYGDSQPGDQGERILYPKQVFAFMYFTVFDSSNNVLGEYPVPTTEPISFYNQLYYETWPIPDGSSVQSYIDTYLNSAYEIGQNWNEDYLFDRQALIYLEAGQRVRPRIKLLLGTHPTPLQAAQRVVEYGLRPDSNIKTFYVRSGGGAFAPVNPLLHRSLRYEFTRPIDTETWALMKENAAIGAQIGIGETLLTNTHISTVTRKPNDGETVFEMMANRNQNYI